MWTFRELLIFPLIGQTLIVTGLVTRWSLQVGEQSSQDLLVELSTQTSSAIENRLENHLLDVRKLNELNTEILNQNLISSEDFDAISELFLNQVTRYDVGYILLGMVDGRFVDAGHAVTARGIVTERIEPKRFGNNKLHSYVVDVQGNPSRLLEDPIDYPFQKEAWYTAATQAGHRGWTPIYVWESPSAQEISIAFTSPIYDSNNQLIGAIAVEQRLLQISRFLKKISDQNDATTFIVEHDGKLIASSQLASFLRNDDRLKATESADPLIQQVSSHVERELQNWDSIQVTQRFSLNIQGQEHFVQVSPWAEGEGLHWWTVIILPKSKFMARTNAYFRRALLLIATTLVLSTASTIAFVHLIKRAIDQLNRSAMAISTGDFDQVLQPSKIREINDFSQSFNNMAVHLKQSFALLSQANERLEQTVEQRTADLKVLNQKLEQLSQTDELTALPNRRYFNHYFDRVWSQAKREKSNLSLIMIDIDYFKKYNDFYGHQEGDKCIQRVAHILRETIKRPTDFVARYGGEEFIVVLPLTDIMGASTVASNIQRAIATARLPHAKSRISSFVTLSLGVATITPNKMNHPECFLSEADQALYIAKQNGRNQICHAASVSSLT